MSFVDLAFLKKRFAKRCACLSATQDRPAALYQMGAAHAGNYTEIHRPEFSLSSSNYQGSGRKRKATIPECLTCDEQAVTKDWPDGWMSHQTHVLCREAWGGASTAKSQNVPVPVISEALGHDSEDTTRIYLALLDSSVVDKAHSKVIRSMGWIEWLEEKIFCKLRYSPRTCPVQGDFCWIKQ